MHQNISNSIRNLTRKVVLGEFSNTDIYSVYYSFKNNSAYGGYKTFTNTLQTELINSLLDLSKDKFFIPKYRERYNLPEDKEITFKEIVGSFKENMPDEINGEQPIELASYLTDKFGEIESSAEKTLSSDLDQVLIPLFKNNNMNVLSSEEIKEKVDALTYDEAIAETERVLSHLEEGNLPIDEVLSQSRYAVALITQCRTKIAQVGKEVDRILDDLDPTPNQE